MAHEDTEALKAMLIEYPEVDNAEIDAAIKDGLTFSDVEWNQRLARPWLYRASNAKEERAARIGYYTANGVEQAAAESYVP